MVVSDTEENRESMGQRSRRPTTTRVNAPRRAPGSGTVKTSRRDRARVWYTVAGAAIGVGGLLILLVTLVGVSQAASATPAQPAVPANTVPSAGTLPRHPTGGIVSDAANYRRPACVAKTPFNPPRLGTLASSGTLALDQSRRLAVVVSASYGATATVDSIAEFDAASGAAVRSNRVATAPPARTTAPILSEGTFVALDEATERIFVLHQPFAQGGGSPPGRVDVFDERTLALLRTVPVGSIARPPVVDEGTGRVFIANQQSGTITVLEAGAGALLRTVAVADAALQPSAPPIVDGRTGRVFFAENTAQGAVAVLDARSGALLTKVAVGPYPQAIAVDPANGHVLVGSRGSGSAGGAVSVLDGRRGAILRTGNVLGAPTGLLVDGITHRAFVSYADNVKVSMLDAATARVLLTERVRSDVDAAGHLVLHAVLPPPQPGDEAPPTLARIDEKRRWVVVSIPQIVDDDGPEVGSAQLATLDSRTGTIIHTVPEQGIWPDAAAVDDRTGRAFVQGADGITLYDISCLTSYYVFADLPQ